MVKWVKWVKWVINEFQMRKSLSHASGWEPAQIVSRRLSVTPFNPFNSFKLPSFPEADDPRHAFNH